jgi:hypothetical protein
MLICEKCLGNSFYLTKNNILTCRRCLYPVHTETYFNHFWDEMRKVVKTAHESE